MQNGYFVYILMDGQNKLTYTGVTNDLKRRVFEHKTEAVEGFTKRYHIHKLVFYERYSDIKMAIAREKQIKGWVRAKKNMLVERMNPNYDDLWERL